MTRPTLLPTVTVPARWRLRAVLASAALGLCLVAPVAHAADPIRGEYSAEVGGVSGDGWTSWSAGGPFSMAGSEVRAAAGTFDAGARGARRLHMPAHVVILGGKARGRAWTPDAPFALMVRQGSTGNAVRTVYTSSTAVDFVVPLLGGHDWVEVGLQTTQATRTGSGRNVVTLGTTTLRLFDDVAPAVRYTTIAPTDRWIGPGCAQWAALITDEGSGATSAVTRNLTTGSTLDAWSAPVRTTTHPGEASVVRSGCLGTGAVHGTNVFTTTVSDAGRRTAATSTRARFDLRPPMVGGLPPDHTPYTSPTPSWPLTISDPDSGVVAAAVHIDGVQVATAGSTAVPDSSLTVVAHAAESLQPGTHVIRVEARDAVGNPVTLERTVVIGDVAPPRLVLSSPGTQGSSRPWIVARASDAGSGIDRTSWTVRVDGVSRAFVDSGDAVQSSVGPLTGGSHRIEVSVRDRAGNRGAVSTTYTVVGVPATQGGLAVGTRRGLFAVGRCEGSRPAGQPRRIMLFAAAAGAPVPDTRVVVVAPGADPVVARTDASGVATVTVRPRVPGTTVATSASVAGRARIGCAVTPSATLRARRKRGRVGRPIVLRGRIAPLPRGARVTLQARVRDTWYTLPTRVRVGARGRIRTAVTASVAGVVEVRIRVSRASGWGESVSRPVRLRFRARRHG